MAKNPQQANSSGNQAFRFAHPFFTDVPIADRKTIKGVGKRMTDFVQTRLEPIPEPMKYQHHFHFLVTRILITVSFIFNSFFLKIGGLFSFWGLFGNTQSGAKLYQMGNKMITFHNSGHS